MVNREALTILSNALRGQMPLGFRWDFGEFWAPMNTGECYSAGCALGLAAEILPDFREQVFHKKYLSTTAAQNFFGLSDNVFNYIFYGFIIKDCQLHDAYITVVKKSEKYEVQPHHVADLIDRYLKGELNL